MIPGFCETTFKGVRSLHFRNHSHWLNNNALLSNIRYYAEWKCWGDKFRTSFISFSILTTVPYTCQQIQVCDKVECLNLNI